jgi:hypothetical protein
MYNVYGESCFSEIEEYLKRKYGPNSRLVNKNAVSGVIYIGDGAAGYVSLSGLREMCGAILLSNLFSIASIEKAVRVAEITGYSKVLAFHSSYETPKQAKDELLRLGFVEANKWTNYRTGHTITTMEKSLEPHPWIGVSFGKAIEYFENKDKELKNAKQ